MKRRLERLLLGLLALGLGAWLTATLLDQSRQAARRGNTELQRDALFMLWSPAVFGLAGSAFLMRALRPGRRRAARQAEAAIAPPGPVSPSLYQAACRELGLAPGAAWPVVRATWRRQLRQWHPDSGGDPQRWLRRQAAYQLLEAWEAFARTINPS